MECSKQDFRASILQCSLLRSTAHRPLASDVGYNEGRAVHLQYGKLARRLANKLGVMEKPYGFWLLILVDWEDGRDPENDQQEFVLRQSVVEAMEQLGLVKHSRAG